jgi:hypothetical protein
MKRTILVTLVACLLVVAPAPAKDKKKSGKDGTVLATVNGEPVTKVEWAEIMKGNKWHAASLRSRPGFVDKMQGRPYEDFFFTEEIVKIRAMSQKYQTNLPEMKSTIDAIYKRLMAGEDFAALARETSQDAGTAVRGGDLGDLKEFHEMVFPFNRIVMKMKPGEISEPFMTIFGYHIAMLEESHPPVENKGKRVKVRNILIRFPSSNPRNESEQLASQVKVEVLDKKLCKKLVTYCNTEG